MRTPLVVEGGFGSELIVNSSERVDAYDPRTGAFLWHVGGSNRFPIPSPVFHNGVIYASRGYRSGPFMALRPGGRGDVTTTHVQWQVETGAPYVSSLLYYEGAVYMANDVGVLTAVNAISGERIWQERVDGVFSASPVAAAGHVYFVSENGDTVVVKAGRPPQVVARNALGERSVASPAISNGQLFIRTDGHLVCIGNVSKPWRRFPDSSDASSRAAAWTPSCLGRARAAGSPHSPSATRCDDRPGIIGLGSRSAAARLLGPSVVARYGPTLYGSRPSPCCCRYF
jgi:hypothetical protein